MKYYIHSFTRMTSAKAKFESFIFRIQSSIGKLFPINLKESLYSFFKVHHSLSFNHIKSDYTSSFSLFKPKTKDDILNLSLNFLKREYQLYFPDCELDFINALFEVSKPKIYKKNKIIINIGKKVDKLYFLLSGILFAFDENNKNIFTIIDNAIFCDYEFITGSNTEYKIKSHPKIPAFGFIIKKIDWDNIAKKYILSANKFIKFCIEKRNIFLQKINKIYKSNKNNKNNIDIKRNLDKDNNKNKENIFVKINKYREELMKSEMNFIKLKQNLFESLNEMNYELYRKK